MTFSILSRLFYTVYTDMSFKENIIVYPKFRTPHSSTTTGQQHIGTSYKPSRQSVRKTQVKACQSAWLHSTRWSSTLLLFATENFVAKDTRDIPYSL